MVVGAVRKNRPLINLVIGWGLKTKEVLALVDTGFTGELKLSAKEAIDLGIASTHLKFVQLANGEKSQMYAGLAMVSMEGVENMVSALISGGMPIIGVGLLKRFGYNLNIDFKKDFLVLQKQ